MEYLGLMEVDERGRIVLSGVRRRRLAGRQARGHTRLIAGDPVAAASLGPVAELVEAFNDRDLARQRAVPADDVVGRTTVGQAWPGSRAREFVDYATVLWGLAPDSQFDAAHMLACDRHGFVGAGRIFGTLADGGGAFEICTISVFSVERGRITRYEVFEPEDVDAALARFVELRPDPLRIPPNAATRASDRHQQALETRDWGALDALCAPTLEFDDRRRSVLITGDRDMFIASGRLIGGPELNGAYLPLHGRRSSALEHVRWIGADHRVPFEMDNLS
jgi:hypothetical protein